MKAKLIATALVASSLAYASSALADSSSVATQTTTVGAAALITGNQMGSSAGANASNGPQTTSVGVQTGGAFSTVGDQSVFLSQDFRSKGSDIPIQPANIPTAIPGSAQLFFSNGTTNPPQITGVMAARWAQKICNQTYTTTSGGSVQKEKGQSGDTLIRATLKPDYNNKRWAVDNTAPVVSFGLPDAKTGVVCVGTMTLQAKSGAGDVDIDTLDHDAAQFSLQLVGYPRLWLVSPETAIGGALGVETHGTGFGLGGSGAGLAGAATAALGISGGRSDGTTTPTSRLGTTYVIFAEPIVKGGSTVVGPSDFDDYRSKLIEPPHQPVVAKVKEAAAAKR